MKKSTSLMLGFLSIATLLSVPNNASAYNTTGYYWDNSVVRFNYADDMSSDYEDELKDALASWNNAVEKYIAFGRDTKKSRVFIFKEDDYGKTGWTAETSVTPYDGSDIIRNASMSPNSYYMDDMSASKKEGVFAHELGHVLGLDHVKDPNQVMSTTKDGRKVKEPGKDDIAGIKSIYKP